MTAPHWKPLPAEVMELPSVEVLRPGYKNIYLDIRWSCLRVERRAKWPLKDSHPVAAQSISNSASQVNITIFKSIGSFEACYWRLHILC